MKKFGIVVAVALVIFVGGPMLFIADFGCSMINEAANVAKEQLGPRALLKKYEWFKDAAAQLTAKHKSLGVLKTKIADLEGDYEGEKRKDWARDDRNMHGQWRAELDGLKMSYNNLAGEYNAAMAKINYAFCNIGDLPAGATEVLPRDFALYVSE